MGNGSGIKCRWRKSNLSIIIPSLIPNHIWSSLSDTLANVDIASTQCPFGLLEIWDENTEEFEYCLKKALNYIDVDVYLSPIMQKQGLELIGASTKEIQEALDYVKGRIGSLVKCGVNNITFSSPQIRKDVSYSQSIMILEESLLDVCKYCAEFDVNVGFEAFDVTKDKCRLLGRTNELLDVCQTIKCMRDNFSLTWDSGHFALEGEDLLNSLARLKKYIRRIHISNYSLHYNKWYYGDKHLPFGLLGSMSISMINEIIEYINTEMDDSVETVSFEVACHPQIIEYSSPDKILNHIMSLLPMLKIYRC